MKRSVISNTGPYADLWSNLKSFEYSLERAESHDRSQITKLDEERLMDLVEFFEDTIDSERSEVPIANLSSWASQHKYMWAMDFRGLIKTALSDLTKPLITENKLDEKIRQLVKPIKEFLHEENRGLFPLETQTQLKKTLKFLLTNTEISMYR